MRIKHYYCLTQADKRITVSVLNCLDKYQHKYSSEDFSQIGHGTWYTFEVFEDQPEWEELKPLLSDRTPNSSEKVYSKKELSDAKWLSVRSDNANKIYCDNDAIDRTFEFIRHNGKAKHRIQKAPYEMRKGVKWNGSRFFYGADGNGFANLFTSNVGRDRLSELFNGISFLPVYRYRTMIPIDDIWQVRFDHILPNEGIVLGRGEEDIHCPYCGRVQYRLGHLYGLALYKQYLDPEVDFYTTEAIFHDGFADPMIICSHQAYLKLKDHEMTAKLRFEPVELM